MLTNGEIKALEIVSMEKLIKNAKAAEIYEKIWESFDMTKDMKVKYPSYYGGAYIDQNDNLVILVTNENDNNIQDIERRVCGQMFITRQVEYTREYLDSLVEKINCFKIKNPDTLSNKNIIEYYVSDEKNQVIVALKNDDKEAVEAFRRDVFDASAVAFVKAEGELIDHVDVGPGFPHSNATVAYRVKRNGVNGFFTAAHAVSLNAYLSSTSGVAFAKCTARKYGGYTDAAFCEIMNAGYALNNIINGTELNLSTSVSSPLPGTTVLKKGKATGLTSGTIVSNNYSTTVGGVLFTYLSTATYSSAPGDSGAVVYRVSPDGSIRYTVGIHKGSGSHAVYCQAQLVNGEMSATRF